MKDREATRPPILSWGGGQYELSSNVCTVGRSARNDVVLDDPLVSRAHAEIRHTDEGWVLHDRNSTNGTYLNGRRVIRSEPLRDGDEIRIGQTILTFVDPEATLHAEAVPHVVYDRDTGDLWVDRRLVRLSPKERRLFDFLYQHVGIPQSKDAIAAAVWPEYQAEVFDYQVESLVKRLREKIERDPRNPSLILTDRGRGYRLNLP
ncbi:MAG TPA: FHA domain-containing protein [Caldilineae bacterium]|nr:FHA domain-containing protein [Caldilineae bacterium]